MIISYGDDDDYNDDDDGVVSKQGFIILSVAVEILDKQLSNERHLRSKPIPIPVITIIFT